jgi:hypothetical protein
VDEVLIKKANSDQNGPNGLFYVAHIAIDQISEAQTIFGFFFHFPWDRMNL